MAKIKDVKFTIDGKDYAIHINCDSKGIFSANIPDFIARSLDLKPRLEANVITAIEKDLTSAIIRYKEAQTTEELYIGIRYGASGVYADKEDGSALFYKSEYGVSLSFESSSPSTLLFDFQVILKETVDGVEKYYSTELGKDKHRWSTDPEFEPEKYYKDSELWDSKLKKLKLIPYTPTALSTLIAARDKIRAVSEMLHNFIEKDTEKILLILNNQKLLN